MTTLAWGVKQSFRNYVLAAGGTIAPSGGAAQTPDGAFTFPAGPDSAQTLDADGRPQGVGRFQGEVRFLAHGGMLSVTLTDPWLEPTDAGLMLSVAETATRRTAIARLDLGAATTEADGAVAIPAAITLDGMMVLGDQYLPGTALDPVRLVGG